MAALISYKPHARDISLTVTNKDDVAERHRTIFVRHKVVDKPVIMDAKRALIDAEKILRLCHVVDRKRRPFRRPVCVISERRSEHFCELLPDLRRLDHLLDARRDDEVLQFHMSCSGTGIDTVEPITGAAKQRYSLSMLRKVLSAYGNILSRSTLQHESHVGKYFVGFVL